MRDADRIVGAVVVKVSLDGLESLLSEVGNPVYISDGYGVVLISTLAELRLTSLCAIPPVALSTLEATK